MHSLTVLTVTKRAIMMTVMIISKTLRHSTVPQVLIVLRELLAPHLVPLANLARSYEQRPPTIATLVLTTLTTISRDRFLANHVAVLPFLHRIFKPAIVSAKIVYFSNLQVDLNL